MSSTSATPAISNAQPNEESACCSHCEMQLQCFQQLLDAIAEMKTQMETRNNTCKSAHSDSASHGSASRSTVAFDLVAFVADAAAPGSVLVAGCASAMCKHQMTKKQAKIRQLTQLLGAMRDRIIEKQAQQKFVSVDSAERFVSLAESVFKFESDCQQKNMWLRWLAGLKEDRTAKKLKDEIDDVFRQMEFHHADVSA